MVHLRPIILALLLALAGPAAAIPSSAPSLQSSATMATADNQVYEPANTSAVMTLGEDADETRAFVQPSLDVGASLAIQHKEMESQVALGALETQFEEAETREDRRDLLFQYATSIDTRRSEIQVREQIARQGYQNGSISGREYLRTLVLIQAHSKQLQNEIVAVQGYASDVPQFTLTDYIGPFEKQLISFQGPVVDKATQISFGTDSTVKMYLSTAEQGIVLSMVDDGTYTREVFREDHRNFDDEGQLTQDRAIEIVEQTYPWASNQSSSSTWRGPNSKGYHYRETGYNHGNIVSYVDVGSETVFKEYQTKYLTLNAATRAGFEVTRPKGPGIIANESGLLLTVNRSYPGGPMYVSLQDNETGDYVEGTVAIEGETVGQTTTEGGLWTLSPAGSFNVSASSGLDVVTVETRATRPIQQRNTTQG